MIFSQMRKKQRKWIDKLRDILYKAKDQYGLESVTISHKVAGPLESAGSWYSKDAIYGMCSTAMHAFYLGTNVYGSDITYALVNTTEDSILVAPLHTIDYFYILTVPPEVDRGELYKSIAQQVLPALESHLTHQENPLLDLTILLERKIDFMDYLAYPEGSEVKPDKILPPPTVEIDPKVSSHVRDLVFDYLKTSSEIRSVEITLAGGIPLCGFSIDPSFEQVQKASYHLFSTASRHATRMIGKPLTILQFERLGYSYFIYDVAGGVFSTVFLQDEGDFQQARYFATQVAQHISQIA